MLRKTLLITLTTALALPLSAAADRPMIDPATRELQKDQLLPEFDVSNPQIDLDRLVVGIPRKDAIPAITDPKRIPGDSADYLGADDRVIVVEVNGEAVAYPFAILNWHEIVNDTVGGQPVVVVYCPLCDSASAAHRTLEVDGETETLEFGVSGFLLYSNVVMYERTTDALWSQVAMEAVSGPMVGRALGHLPWRVETAERWMAEHPDSTIMTLDTGHMRDYGVNPYADYFDNHRLYFPVAHSDDRLPFKTRVVGIEHGGEAAAFTARWVAAQPDRRAEVEVGGGAVVLEADDQGGVAVVAAPEAARTVHTFWFAWNAFHPETSLTDAQPEPGVQRTLRDLEAGGGAEPDTARITGDRPPGAGQ